MDIKKRLKEVEKIMTINYKEEGNKLFIKNITDLIDKEMILPFRFDKMIQEIIKKSEEV